MKKQDKRHSYPSFWKVSALVIAVLMLNGLLKYIGGFGINNSAQTKLIQYANNNGLKLEDYPDEMINMFKYNSETEEFVEQYPTKIINFKPEELNFNEYKNAKKPPLLMQWDTRWGYMQYNGNVFGLTGSAPTCLSMVAIYVMQDISMTPVHVADFARLSGMEARPEALLSEGGKAMGMNVVESPKNAGRVRANLSDDRCAAICLTSGRTFSQVIVITGVDDNNRFHINDPSSKKRSDESYNFQEISSEIKKIWIYSPKLQNSQNE